MILQCQRKRCFLIDPGGRDAIKEAVDALQKLSVHNNNEPVMNDSVNFQ